MRRHSTPLFPKIVPVDTSRKQCQGKGSEETTRASAASFLLSLCLQLLFSMFLFPYIQTSTNNPNFPLWCCNSMIRKVLVISLHLQQNACQGSRPGECGPGISWLARGRQKHICWPVSCRTPLPRDKTSMCKICFPEVALQSRHNQVQQLTSHWHTGQTMLNH